jgi:hypothetical protein
MDGSNWVGVALVDQRTILDPGLTTRSIAGINWTADTAFVHHKKGDHLALPFLIRSLERTPASTPTKGTIPSVRDVHLVLPRDRFMEINAGTVVDLATGQIHINVQRAPGRMPQSQGRD